MQINKKGRPDILSASHATCLVALSSQRPSSFTLSKQSSQRPPKKQAVVGATEKDRFFGNPASARYPPTCYTSQKTFWRDYRPQLAIVGGKVWGAFESKTTHGMSRKNSATGNRTRVIRVTGGYTNHYTIAECSTPCALLCPDNVL